MFLFGAFQAYAYFQFVFLLLVSRSAFVHKIGYVGLNNHLRFLHDFSAFYRRPSKAWLRQRLAAHKVWSYFSVGLGGASKCFFGGNIFLDLFLLVILDGFYPWDSSPFFTTIWEKFLGTFSNDLKQI